MQSITLSSTNRSNSRPERTNRWRSLSRTNAGLWTVQSALALTFVFAGATKLAAPGAAASQSHLPLLLMAVVGVCEVLGGVGLVLPGLTGIRRGLTPFAAAGLVVIMVGATTVTAVEDGFVLATMPFAVGALAVLIAYRRSPGGARRLRSS